MIEHKGVSVVAGQFGHPTHRLIEPNRCARRLRRHRIKSVTTVSLYDYLLEQGVNSFLQIGYCSDALARTRLVPRGRRARCRRERQQIASCRTTDFEYPGVGYPGWIQSEHPSDSRKLSRTRLRVCVRRVRRFVIAGTHGIDRSVPIPGT